MFKLSFLPLMCLGICLVAALPDRSSAGPNGPGPFEVAETIHVGGKGGFDYVTVDSQGKRLYIPRGTHTQILDLTTGKLVGDIPGQQANHGVAINRQIGRGFISDGPGYVVIFDLKTNAVLGKVQVVAEPTALSTTGAASASSFRAARRAVSRRFPSTSIRPTARPIRRSSWAVNPNIWRATARDASS